MQLTSMSNPFPKFSPRKKLLKEEIELRERSETEISPLWKIVTVASYFVIVAAGITTSICIGSLLAAFTNNCVLYARITVRGLDEIAASGQNLTLYDDNIVVEQYGALSDCTFTEYCSAASAIFGGMWGIMFLQCGRGGITKRSATQSWQIVPPALLTNLTFFIISTIIFAKTTGGLTFFCNNLRSETTSGELASNITTCKDILAFRFPHDQYNTNLYLNYILAQVSSFVTFFGWLITLFVMILRCFIPVDFTVYGRRRFDVRNISDEQALARSVTSADINLPSTSTSVEVLDHDFNSPVATTSFTIPALKNKERVKKLS